MSYMQSTIETNNEKCLQYCFIEYNIYISLLFFTVDTSIITKVKIPPYVILGSTVHLYCVFELKNGTDVYMLKWLKNDEEFYRSVPKALLRPNRRRTFHVEGVKVDIENSKV